VRGGENRTATVGTMMRRLEVLFRRWGHPLVFLFPNNPVCLLAGAARMPVAIFTLLNITGTLARLVAIAILGEALQEPIDSVLGFVARYRIPLLVLSIVAVAFTMWSETRKGTSELDQLRRLEHELDDDEESSSGSEEP
jgi:membrane protein DedA with SNARE-associated domain